MFILNSFIFILFITTVYCQSVSVKFPTIPANTDIGTCTCDLTGNKCDSSCCCDPDCTSGDLQVFSCSSRSSISTSVAPMISTIQSSCYKDLSIFKTDSPYIIQKMGELVCVDFERYTGSQYYQQPQTQTLNTGAFLRSFNADNSVIAPKSLPTGLTNYQVGSPILTYNSINSERGYYSLPVQVLNNPLCSGSQTITYMDDFTSTCSQYVSSSTCMGALNPTTYTNSLCFIQSQSSSTVVPICSSSTATNSAMNSSTVCIGALTSLNIRIFYSNPTGIVSINVSTTTTVATTILQQTFTIQYIQANASSVSSTATRNPGYLQSSNIPMLTLNGSSAVSTLSSTQFSLLQPLSDGSCNTATRTPILFGQNVRTTCTTYNPSTTCTTNIANLLMPADSINYYVAAYSNSVSSNISTDWLPVVSCTSVIGSPNPPQCSNGILLSADSSSGCYVRLDIEIAYTNIGTVYNPQPVLSSVIFNYQSLSGSNFTGSITIIESVTFQDISSPPVVEEGLIPVPDTRLPADFFYPFTTSQATAPMTNLFLSYVLISILFILM